MNHPHKSTTHQEMFFHIFFDPSETARGYKGATVFCRLEKSGWCWSIALCAPSDQFNRRVGRSQARRRYFNYDRFLTLTLAKPTYDWAKEQAINIAKTSSKA